MKSKDIRKELDFDSLVEAEKITGKSYKDDYLTSSIGFSGHIIHSHEKEKLLNSMGDTTFSNTEENYLKIVKSIGFESVLIEPFMNDDGVEERLHVMWHNEFSILLVFDTHTWGDDGSWAKSGKSVPPPNVNGGHFYYNWSPNLDCENHCTSSGGYVGNGDNEYNYATLFNPDFTPHILPPKLRKIEPKYKSKFYDKYRVDFKVWCKKVNEYIKSNKLVNIWSGYHDCREAIKFKISELNKNGTFVKQWTKPPLLWLLHYMDTKNKGYDSNFINKTRINKLPEHVIKAIGYEL